MLRAIGILNTVDSLSSVSNYYLEYLQMDSVYLLTWFETNFKPPPRVITYLIYHYDLSRHKHNFDN